MANWEAIKNEYVTSAISYRRLAEKHGVTLSALSERGRQEGWPQLRRQSCKQPLRSPQQQRRLQQLMNVTDRLLDKISGIVDTLEPGGAACNSLKHISGTLKDIKDIQMLRSDADIREQEAKIAGMEKRSEEDVPGSVTVVLSGEVESYAE